MKIKRGIFDVFLTKVAIIVPTVAQPVASGLENNVWLHVPHGRQQDQSVYQKRHWSNPNFFFFS